MTKDTNILKEEDLVKNNLKKIDELTQLSINLLEMIDEVHARNLELILNQ